MALGLPDLVVGLGLDTKKFAAGLSSARGMLGGFASAAKSAIIPVTAAFAAATGAAYVLQGRIGKLAGVADEAARTGLSGAFLQRLGFAADQSGVSVETVTASIKKMTVAIGSGSKGFADIGLSLDELRTMSPEEQFRKVAERISSMGSAAERAAAAQKVFGRSGFEMTGLFTNGMNSVNELLEEAKRLGIGLSDEALKKAADADDAIQRMYSTFGGLFDQLAVGVAPLFKSIADYITDWIPPITEFLNKFNEMPEKAQFLSDVLVASVDLATETIKQKWAEMLSAMLSTTKDAALKIHDTLTPTGWVLSGLKAAAGSNPFGAAAAKEAAGGGLTGAQARFAGVIGRVQNQPSFPFVGPQNQQRASKGSGDFAGLGQMFADKFSEPMAMAKTALQQKAASLGLEANWWQSVIGQAFTGERPQSEEIKPTASLRLAGAMSRGSSEAYSVIANAMARSRDPVVNATKQAADKIVKAVNDKPTIQFNLLEAFGL